mgnify:FL=1
MTAVSTPDSLRTQPMSGSISPQAQDGAVTREITASNEWLNNNVNFHDNSSIVFLNNPKQFINNIPRTNEDYVNKNGDGVNFLNYEQSGMQDAIKDSAMRQVQNTMIPNKQADMNLRPALNALKEKGYTAFLQPNLFPKNANDRFMLTFMNPTTGKMERIDNPEYLQQLLA